MNKIFRRAITLALSLCTLSGVARADKGMWLMNELTTENLAQMKALGFSLSKDELYNLSKPSVASSVVIFGRGCTGVTVSGTGLIMTNHHCGFGAIQSQSTVDHDYLRDGFVSQTIEQELPIEGLEIRYLADIRDITPEIDEALKKQSKKIKSEMDRLSAIQTITSAIATKENTRLQDKNKEVTVRSYYAGNKYYMLTYNVFRDVRMVFAPPQSIGKFGGDTDNWMWPRHTGDFAVFRVYADKDNKPARYSKDNVPYKPAYFATISTEGCKEGDFAMTIGFPGSTNRYIPSWGIENRMRDENQARIDVRGAKQAIWRKAMDADQATRIKYADKYASSSNYWKNSIGMNRGLRRLGVVERKREEEKAFAEWASKGKSKEYKTVLDELQKAYETVAPIQRSLMYLSETLIRGTEITKLARTPKKPELLDELYKDYIPALDEEVLAAMLDLARKEIPQSDQYDLKGIFELIDKDFQGSSQAFASHLFKTSKVPYKEKASLADDKDPAVLFSTAVYNTFSKLRSRAEALFAEIERGNRIYFRGRQLMDPKRPMPSDANFTMRMSYGSVGGYKPSDGVRYNYYTTTAGILEKYDPKSTEFDLKPDFINLLEQGKWGRWADKTSKDLHVGFISNNDITGGNSGSPVFNGKGEVIGLAFDGNWEAMSGDIEFEPALQRTISVDIRYVLYIIEQWGKSPRLIKELRLK